MRYDSGLEDETDISSILKSVVMSALETDIDISSIPASEI